MSSGQAVLDETRLGSVPYLNARPLVYGLGQGIRRAPPSELATEFDAGKLDVALLSSYFLFERADSVAVADGIAIAADGDVYSVILAFRGRLDSVSRIYLDPASLSSVNLLRVLLPELTSHQPDFHEGLAPDGEARVLIGDPAIRFRSELDDSWTVVDLAGAWKKITGLPFVFAVWGLRRDLPDLAGAAEELRQIKQAGLAELEAIRNASEDPEFAQRYLGGYIRFDLGDREKQAIEEFRRRLDACGVLVREPGAEILYV